MELDRTLFEEYQQYEAGIRLLESKQNALKPKILEMIKDYPKGIEVKGVGIFLTSSRPKWQYSEACMDLKAKVTEMEKEEQATGLATRIEGEPFPVFRPEPGSMPEV